MFRGTWRLFTITGICWILPSMVAAAINVELRPIDQTVILGESVRIGLYVVSDDDETNQLMAAADVILGWNADVLRLTGIDSTGAVPLLVSGFPATDPYHLNEAVPPQDGDGLYLAYAFGGQPVVVTPDGTLLVTFLFDSIGTTLETEVAILPSAGSPVGHTVVYDGSVPGLVVTGTLGSATVQILCMPCLGDLDGDQDIDLLDLAQLLAHYGAVDGAEPTDGDVDCDGDVDLLDLAALLSVYGEFCD